MVNDRRLTRRRLAGALIGTAAAVGGLFAYPTSTGHSSLRPAVIASGSAAGGGTTSTSGIAAASDGSSTTYTGDVVGTRWGPVQVTITVSGGRVVSAGTAQVPNGNPRDEEINSYAVPVLNQEVVQAQSDQIDTVSGATVTSDGYIGSLQSALDAAHLR